MTALVIGLVVMKAAVVSFFFYAHIHGMDN